MSSENGLNEQIDSNRELSVASEEKRLNTLVLEAETIAKPIDNEKKSFEFQWLRCQERYRCLEELLEYASEYGKLERPNLATEIKQLKSVIIYTPIDQLDANKVCEIEAKLEKTYTIMAEMLHPVSVLTLRATSMDYQVTRPWWQALFLGCGSVGRNFFRKLFWVATGLILITLFLDIFLDNDQIRETIEPFLYGALGAVVSVYKNLTVRYINRTLHPYELSTDWLRIFMGGITGGIIVHVFSPFLPETVIGQDIQTTEGGLNVTNMAFGFIAGYSVEFFYQLLDKIIRSITPIADNSQEPKVATSTPRQVQIETLSQSLKEMTDEKDKAAVRQVLEKI